MLDFSDGTSGGGLPEYRCLYFLSLVIEHPSEELSCGLVGQIWLCQVVCGTTGGLISRERAGEGGQRYSAGWWISCKEVNLLVP